MVLVDYVKNLLKHSNPNIHQEDIGIITPYVRQVQNIGLALKISDVGDVKVRKFVTIGNVIIDKNAFNIYFHCLQ